MKKIKEIIAVCVTACITAGMCGCSGKLPLSGNKSGYDKFCVAASVNPKGIDSDNYEIKKGYYEENHLDKEFLDAVKQFSNETSVKLLGDKSENTAYSPLSLYFALSMAANGADNTTKDEMYQLLGLEGKDRDYMAKQVGRLYQIAYNDNKAATLQFANAIWAQEGYPFLDQYIDEIQKDFYADLFEVDFSDKNTKDLMSQWVSDKTNGMIQPKFELSKDLVMDIMNTVYLKARFIDKFSENATKQDVFTKQDGTTVTCDFMNQRYQEDKYLQGDGYKAVRLGLEDMGSFVLILPEEGITVQELIEHPEKLADVYQLDKYQEANVILSLPKFDMSSKLDLKQALIDLGMKQAFDKEAADFSNMSEKRVYVGSATQDVRVKLKEDGIEAAAYTEIQICNAMAAEPKELPDVVITLDHPFMYQITGISNIPIFTGICMDPTAK